MCFDHLPTKRRPLARGLAIAMWAVMLTSFCMHAPASGWKYDVAQLLTRLEHEDIVESSGLAASRRHPGVIWTHNDSGDEPRLFAFSSSGRHLATCRLRNAEALDWEDMGSFQLRGRPYLFVADVGDNTRQREHCTIYLLNEPATNATQVDARPLHFQYEDGPHDCEAVALDTDCQVFILVEKIYVPVAPCRVYELSWRSDGASGRRIARQIGTITHDGFPVPWVTAMDISSDGRRAVIATSGPIGFEFDRLPNESWEQAFARRPREIVLPSALEGRQQGESICYGADDATLFLSSEKKPCPLFCLQARGMAATDVPPGSTAE